MTIDLNCDVAEGVGNEKEIFPFITSANIACGFHAGDPGLMADTVHLCLKHNVAIGAHPSFPDRENFGRTNMDLPKDEVSRLVQEQIDLLKAIATAQGGRLTHVKPHGALYNMAARDAGLAAAVAEAVAAIDSSLVLFGLSGSCMSEAARQKGIPFAHEVFADRTYQADGTLTPRSRKDALIESTDDTCVQALSLAKGMPIQTTDGGSLKLKADTVCLHGDGAHAVTFAKAVREYLLDAGVQIKSYLHAAR